MRARKSSVSNATSALAIASFAQDCLVQLGQAEKLPRADQATGPIGFDVAASNKPENADANSGLLKRRGQDSNLRTRFRVTDLANRRFRPLSHLSQTDSRMHFAFA